MKTSDYVSSIIDSFPSGYVFKYTDFKTEADKTEAVIKTLNRMAGSGKIAKLSKGRFYKPETTPFGDILPSQEQVVKDLMEENGEITGYLTGYSIYNQLRLTSQVSNTIQIGKNQVRPDLKRERYTVTFIKQKNMITKENIHLLQLLDTIRYIKKIPDSSIEASLRRFVAILKNKTDKEISTLVSLSIKYPPATRALFGALLDEAQQSKATDPIFKTLNPITKYKFSGVAQAIPGAGKWNII